MEKCPYCDNGIKTTCYKEKVVCSLCSGTGQYNPNWIQELSEAIKKEMETWPQWMKDATTPILDNR